MTDFDDIDEIVSEFLVESYENLDRYDQDLLALERDPADSDVLSSIFRTMHTVKGTSGFFGFARLEAFTHVAENLLGKLRDGKLEVTAEIASALLATGDAVRTMLGTIERTGAEGDDDVTVLTEQLAALSEPDATGDETPRDAVPTPLLVDPQRDPVPEPAAVPDRAVESEAGPRSPAEAGGRSVADTTIRVDVGLLDELMNLVGELVLARNQIVQLVGQQPDSAFVGASQRLNLITTELQEGVMKTRMQPIGNVWSKLPRVVRDLSLACGKNVHLDLVGQDTELDKTIIEAIKDPLTHLVRNAVDHGIEAPQVRAAAGKPVEGRLVLRAFHEGGQVNIEIADDGAGIDVDAVRAKAVERGVLTVDQAARLSEREALNLIFAAGFSTAEAVTNVSGRGVGMDVVRTNIERIGGTVDVSSEPGHGTTVKVKIPLTLAIVPALIIDSGGDRYAIPQLSLIELVRLEGDRARTGIELVHGVPVHRLRGKLLPIVQLTEELGRDVVPLRDRDVINIVVLQADGHEFGLVVDGIQDTQEIVVKPLGSHLKEASVFAGATIMGDGRVALILDVLGVAQRSRVVSEARERGAVGKGAVADQARERSSLLLVGVGDERRAALPLSQVERLEEFTPDTVEWSGDREVVQYRGDILPLTRLASLLGVGGRTARGDVPLPVVVMLVGEQLFGVVVDDVLDIVEHDVALDAADGRPGLLRSAIVQDRVTDVVDTAALLGGAHPVRSTGPGAAIGA